LPVGRGTLGIGATLLDYGSIEEIAAASPGIDGTETGRRFHAQDNAIVVAYGMPLARIEGLVVGASAEFVSSRVADLSSSTLAATASLGWASRNGWEVMGAVQHVGRAMQLGGSEGALPTVTRLAIAAPVEHIGAFYARPLGEIRGSNGDGVTVALATEAEWSTARGPALFLRAGYSIRTSESDDRWPVSLGAGVTIGAWSIDYAPERFETIDQITHRIGIRYARRASAVK
jgi:hypothetical protein